MIGNSLSIYKGRGMVCVHLILPWPPHPACGITLWYDPLLPSVLINEAHAYLLLRSSIYLYHYGACLLIFPGIQGALLFGQRLEVNYSKYPNINTGPETRDYSNSNLNRFNRNAAKNYRYCCSPTKMIHVSSLPQDVTEEEIVAHLEEHGPIVNTKLFEMNGKKQALVLFDNEEQATEALVCQHATSLGGSIIRISFSQVQSIWEAFLDEFVERIVDWIVTTKQWLLLLL